LDKSLSADSPSIKPFDLHYYSLKVLMSDKTHMVYWGNLPQGYMREKPKEISNIENAIRGVTIHRK
jgi:hypothetical protein